MTLMMMACINTASWMALHNIKMVDDAGGGESMMSFRLVSPFLYRALYWLSNANTKVTGAFVTVVTMNAG